jgi:hypothetical protein
LKPFKHVSIWVGKMKDIPKMISRFDWRNIERSIYGRAHDVIIGEWAHWWLKYSRRDKHKRRIINPAIKATYRKKNYIADILFCEKDNRGTFYKVLGVAEIENNRKKYLYKVDALRAYEKGKGRKEDIKFPHLRFAILCTRFILKSDDYRKEDLKLINKIENKMQRYSKNSKMTWIFYNLYLKKFGDDKPDDDFYIDYLEGYRRFWYTYSFKGKPDCVIFKNGHLRRLHL